MTKKSASVKDDVSTEKLMQDLRGVMADAEELLRATVGQTGEKVSAVRERIQENLAATKERLAATENAVLDSAVQAGKAADEYVHENPWNAVGIAAGVGLVLGMLISRSR